MCNTAPLPHWDFAWCCTVASDDVAVVVDNGSSFVGRVPPTAGPADMLRPACPLTSSSAARDNQGAAAVSRSRVKFKVRSGGQEGQGHFEDDCLGIGG